MDSEVAIFLVIFLLASSVATIAICCLELKAVWVSYRESKTGMMTELDCTCEIKDNSTKTIKGIKDNNGKRTVMENNGTRALKEDKTPLQNNRKAYCPSPSLSAKSNRHHDIPMHHIQHRREDNGILHSSLHNSSRSIDYNDVLRDKMRLQNNTRTLGPVPI